MTSYVDNIILITESGGDIQRTIDGITESLEIFTFNNYVLKINEKYTNLLIYVRKSLNAIANLIEAWSSKRIVPKK